MRLGDDAATPSRAVSFRIYREPCGSVPPLRRRRSIGDGVASVTTVTLVTAYFFLRCLHRRAAASRPVAMPSTSFSGVTVFGRRTHLFIRPSPPSDDGFRQISDGQLLAPFRSSDPAPILAQRTDDKNGSF
jgi:hypothetical protein